MRSLDGTIIRADARTAEKLRNRMSDMDLHYVVDQLRTFIRERFQVPDSDPDFSDDVHLFNYGYVDSFGAVELNTFVETTFTVTVTPDDLIVFPLNTINEIGAFVVRRRAGGI
jgi:D-alanine--poly(phosphoribitol) ligase subunit 2